MRAALLALTLAACGDGDRPEVPHPSASAWSVGAPNSNPIAGSSFTIPRQGKVGYVTRLTGPLTGKTRITLRYRIDMAEGVRIFPPSMPDGPAIITLYLQRRGDDWSAQGDYEAYRWYATSFSQMPLTAGEHEISAPLDTGWTAISYSTAQSNPDGFAAAKAKAERVGFVLGGGTGYGHGVSATGQATLTILSFTIE